MNTSVASGVAFAELAALAIPITFAVAGALVAKRQALRRAGVAAALALASALIVAFAAPLTAGGPSGTTPPPRGVAPSGCRRRAGSRLGIYSGLRCPLHRWWTQGEHHAARWACGRCRGSRAHRRCGGGDAVAGMFHRLHHRTVLP